MRANNSMVVLVCLAFTLPCQAASLNVPGTADPWLAGMPDGTTASDGDIAPAQSPVLVQGVNLNPGSYVEVSNVTGTVSYGPDPYTWPASPADGDLSYVISHYTGDEWSKSDIITPCCSLLGVFLNDLIPSSQAPTGLDFGSDTARNYLTLNPQLNQVFFIGDGCTTTNIQQRVVIPEGATRLFLGTMDGYGWYDNWGTFSAQVNVVPEPATLLFLGLGAVMVRRKRG